MEQRLNLFTKNSARHHINSTAESNFSLEMNSYYSLHVQRKYLEYKKYNLVSGFNSQVNMQCLALNTQYFSRIVSWSA